MPTVAEALPQLQPMLDELTALPLTREKADDLIATIRSATDRPDGADLSLAVDPMFRLAEARETRAFEPLCQFLMMFRPGAYTVDEDNIVTELLSGILVAIYDGNAALLVDIVLARDVDEYVRSSTLCALVHLVQDGKAERAEAERVLVTLPRTSPDPGSILWTCWTSAIATLKLHEFVPLVERVLTGSEIEDAESELEQFHADLARSPEALATDANTSLMQFTPFTTAAAARARTKELADIFNKLSALIGQARADRADDRASRTVRRALDMQTYGRASFEPILNDYRHVGRNDPCPCGSGKKHKKCCLN